MSDVITGTGQPGSMVIPSSAPPPPAPARPQPTAPPGDMAERWVKVGAQAIGGHGEFDYENAYFGGDSGVWKQT